MFNENENGARMTKEEFFDALEVRIYKEFPDYELRRQDVPKSNGVKTCLVVRDPKCEVAPSLRLDDYYAEYEKASDCDAELERISNGVADCVRRAFTDSLECNVVGNAMDAMANWRNAVRCSLVIKDGNDRFLSDMPFKEFLDMAKIYYIAVDDLVEGHLSRITITNEHLASIGCTLDELDEAAMANTIKYNPAEIDSMSKVLAGLMGVSEEEFTAIYGVMDLPMYVVSNQSKCDGAAVIMYPEVRNRICDELGSDAYYLLPSSRHEVICVPARVGHDVGALQRMVHQINAAEVPPEDLLSENVYYYERGKELRICIPEPDIDEAEDASFEEVLDIATA